MQEKVTPEVVLEPNLKAGKGRDGGQREGEAGKGSPVGILGVLLTSCVFLGKLPNFSEPLFPHLAGPFKHYGSYPYRATHSRHLINGSYCYKE